MTTITADGSQGVDTGFWKEDRGSAYISITNAHHVLPLLLKSTKFVFGVLRGSDLQDAGGSP